MWQQHIFYVQENCFETVFAPKTPGLAMCKTIPNMKGVCCGAHGCGDTLVHGWGLFEDPEGHVSPMVTREGKDFLALEYWQDDKLVTKRSATLNRAFFIPHPCLSF